MSPKSIRVCLSPALLPFYDLSDTIAVVIDIFRATSSMCYGLANGANAIIPVEELAECLSYRSNGHLLAAERDGKVVEGFDFGNSPFSYTKDKVEGKTIVLTTTNGTRAIQRCIGAEAVVIGSFLNISALTDWLKNQSRHILLVCAGWKNHFNLEDTVFSGALVHRLKTTDIELDDAAYAAESLYLEAQGNLSTYLSKASHSKRMQHLQIAQDVAFCLLEDQVSVIPILKGHELVPLTLPHLL
ncbi:2-phosphosulfolactate phosphatase [Parapedobacter indicus]|uniref:Probable 2-phosphosulfolactate phosphatase n=1 Tax=Parapedobacter indicus TaxID=1477437 RepID=A0A1I3HKK7_9SPHI|nr:2-phosphosulfolactate phosphatase [Parapedobacter indicus]PPL03071.1 2-phosphosulfolactate phosphatase [Parapedobacter indicus]SFI36050.1 2-phosphosulfolactate phosphatase [Parapedobacter indicus]